MHNFSYDGLKYDQSSTLQHKNNKTHHKCTQKNVCLNKLISFPFNLP